MEGLNEKCAVFGVFGKGMDVARLSYFGLFALQHRGQESSGIAVSNGTALRVYKDMGLVSTVFTEDAIEPLKGHIAIGHNRYSTSKGSTAEHAQPLVLENTLAFAHNGNLPSVVALQEFLKGKGIDPGEHSDSRLMAEAILWHKKQGMSLADAVQASYPLFTGAFSILAMDATSLIAARDPYGIRPLSLARATDGGFVVTSETCALNPVNAVFERDVKPGEMIVIDENGVRSVQVVEGEEKLDIFEFIYFARHDSRLMGKSVYEVRKNFGKFLAKEYPVEADVVIGVPETSLPAALGYAQESGIPYEMGLNKNRYIQRTFIQPDQKLRDKSVKMKLSPIPDVLKGKRVVVIDDSIVRGTTSKPIIDLLFEAGATEVHFLVSCPPIRFPDFYGIDTPKQDSLFAFGKSLEEMNAFLGATSLHFLSLEGMLASTGLPAEHFNTSCFTGEYPIDLRERFAEVMRPTTLPVEAARV